VTPIERALAPTQSDWGSSRYNEFRRCAVAHDYRYVLRIRDEGHEQPHHFAVGTLCHAVLRYEQEKILLPEDAGTEPWAAVVDAWVAKGGSQQAAVESAELMRSYFSHYGEANAGWGDDVEILAVEQPLRCDDELGPLPFTATADTIIRMHGQVVVVDHKTRGRALPPDYAEQQQVRPQFPGLSYLVQRHYCLGAPPPVLVNVLGKPTGRKPAWFRRVMVQMPEHHIRRWAVMQTRTAISMAHHGLPTPNWNNCAPEIGWRCDHFERCHGTGSGGTEQ